MKKIIICALVSASMLCSVAFATSNSTEDSKTEESNVLLTELSNSSQIDETEATPKLFSEQNNNISISTFDELKSAINASNIPTIITITDDIIFTDNLFITKDNVTILSENAVQINLNKFRLEIKADNITLENLAFSNYGDNAIIAYKANNALINSCEFIGNFESLRAIDVNNSTLSINGTITSEHKSQAIRLINSSVLDVMLDNSFENEKVSIEENVGTEVINITEEKGFLLPEEISVDKFNHYYLYEYSISTEAEFLDALTKNNVNIVILNDIKFEGAYNNNRLQNSITTNIKITGSNLDTKLDMNGKTLYLTSKTASIENIWFSNYSQGIPLYLFNVKGYMNGGNQVVGASLNNLKFVSDETNNTTSPLGIKIVASFVEINNKPNSTFVGKGHSNSIIEVSSVDNSALSGATLNLYSGFELSDNNLIILGVEANSHIDSNLSNSIQINDNSEQLHFTSPMNSYYSSLGDVTLYRYAHQNEVSVTTFDEFLEAVQTKNNKVVLENKIDVPLEFANSSNPVITVAENTTITSNNTETLNLNGASLSIKYFNVKISNLIIDNEIVNTTTLSSLDIYNTEGTMLEDLKICNSNAWGINVNGSVIYIKDITTKDNAKGGIFITRSRTLASETMNRDAIVYASGTMNHIENSYYVKVVNLELLDTDSDGKILPSASRYTENRFIYNGRQSREYEETIATPKSLKLSTSYLDLFGFTGSDRDNEYEQFDTDYFLEKERLNVVAQTEVPINWQVGDEISNNSNTGYISLDNTGLVDNTENLKTLISYAGNYGKEIYFPEGTYLISDSIVLTNINGQSSLSNFSIKGSKNELSVLLGVADSTEIKSIGDSTDYHYSIINFNSDNMVYDNVSFGFKGTNKINISFTNNVFLNGSYSEDDSRIYLNAYLDLENSSYYVAGNSFFRTNEHAGKGIYLYDTFDTVLEDNYFGDLTHFGSGNNLDPVNMLPRSVVSRIEMLVSNELINPNVSNGNFFTGINLVRKDENVLIQNNYFDMGEEKDVVFPEGTPLDKPIYGLNDLNAPHRKDHIIYAKGYTGVVITENYFQGMENGGAGGVKVRNGTDLYVGANYFDNVPLLMYVYADLSHEEVVFEDAIIFNNLFNIQNKPNTPHAGILFYQSFVNGNTYNLSINSNSSEKEERPVALEVDNILMYNNKFSTDDRHLMTLNNNSIDYSSEFMVSNNVYTQNANDYITRNNVTDELQVDEFMYANKPIEYGVMFDGFVANEISEEEMLNSLRIYDSYKTYNKILIPLEEMSIYTFFDIALEDFEQTKNASYEVFENNNLLSEYDSYSVEEAYEYKIQDINKSNSQADINLYTTEIEALTTRLKNRVLELDNSQVVTRPRPETGTSTNIENTTVEIEEGETPLSAGDFAKLEDISNHWAKNSIEYVVTNGIMNGVSETEFDANGTANRAMIWTVLARMNDVDTTGSDPWYQKGLDWAMENEVSDGTNPMGEITREQLVTMLWRNAGEPVSSYDLSAFTDLSDVSDYAKVAFAWAVENGYVTGKTATTLAPKGKATRGEIATILERILKSEITE